MSTATCEVDCIAVTCEICDDQDCITHIVKIDGLNVCSTCQYVLANDIAA